jgi:hypothetical protein
MLSPGELYPVIVAWLQAVGAVPHATGRASLAHLVAALLAGQSLRAAALARTQVSERGVRARQRHRRVRRALTRPWLSSAWLTPRLVRAALAIVPDPAPHVALDTVRCGGWEVVTAGVVWHGRVLPVGWVVLPYPTPRGRFTPAVLGLLRRVDAAWPVGRRPHLVADRGFPSLELFRMLERLGWGWTVRLRARLTVTLDGAPRALRDVVLATPPGTWTCRPLSYGGGRRGVAGHLVIGRPDALPVLPRHQAGPGSLRHRARERLRRDREVRDKHPGRPAAAARETDRWVVLFTSHGDWQAAGRSYGRRWAAEGSYRDAQGGYDGRHGWDLEPALAREPDPDLADHLLGLWALGTLLQTWLGDRVGRPDAPPLVRDVRARWTTTGRLSVWMRGRFALTDPSGDLRPWLLAALRDGADRLRADRPPLPAPRSPHRTLCLAA